MTPEDNVIASCLYRRSRYCPRTMNRTGLKLKPTLTALGRPAPALSHLRERE